MNLRLEGHISTVIYLLRSISIILIVVLHLRKLLFNIFNFALSLAQMLIIYWRQLFLFGINLQERIIERFLIIGGLAIQYY
jgi:hypothetical protein